MAEKLWTRGCLTILKFLSSVHIFYPIVIIIGQNEFYVTAVLTVVMAVVQVYIIIHIFFDKDLTLVKEVVSVVTVELF